METVRRELLTDALRFYLKFLQRKSDDPELRLETARAYLGAGALQLKLGESGRAEENVRQGIALLNELLAQPPGRPEYHELLAEGWLDLGHIRLETNHPREAEDAYNTARRIAAKRVADSPDSPLRWTNSPGPRGSRNHLRPERPAFAGGGVLSGSAAVVRATHCDRSGGPLYISRRWPPSPRTWATCSASWETRKRGRNGSATRRSCKRGWWRASPAPSSVHTSPTSTETWGCARGTGAG